MLLTSCKTASIIDLIHKDTHHITFDESLFSNEDSILDDYQLNKVMFRVYTTLNENVDIEYSDYALKLAAYKEIDDKKIVINTVVVEGINDIELEKKIYDINKTMTFSEYNNQKLILRSIINLTPSISNYDMELIETSQIKVTININIEDDSTSLNKDLTYILEPNIRTYPVIR
jgi:hypothetical protein